MRFSLNRLVEWELGFRVPILSLGPLGVKLLTTAIVSAAGFTSRP